MFVKDYQPETSVRKSATNSPSQSGLGVSPSGGILPLSRGNMERMGRDMSGKAFFELGYRRNSLVYAGINLRGIAMQIAKLTAVDENDKPIENSELLKLLAKPNPVQSWSELILQIEGNLILGAQCFLHKVRDRAGVVVEVNCYNASQIRPISSTYQVIEKYKYDNGTGDIQYLNPSDVGRLTFGMHDWDRPAYVTGPLCPLAVLLDTDTQAVEMAYSLLTRGAVPASLITLPPKLNAMGMPDNYYSAAELSEYKQLYETSYSGANRGSNMIGPPGTDVKILGFDPKRMMVREFSTIPETRLCAVLGIPLQMTSFYSAKDARTFANYSEARLSFYQDTMIPHGIAIADMLTRAFENEIFRNDRRSVRLKFDWSGAVAMQEFIGKKLQTMYAGNSATLNETRIGNNLAENAEYGEKFLFEILQPVAKTDSEPTSPASKDTSTAA